MTTTETDLLAELIAVSETCHCHEHHDHVAPVAKRTVRHCYRCRDCLAVFFVDSETRRPIDGLLCACGATCRWLGRVEGNSLLQDHERCACDTRCTSATGPNCDCKCGGENHGTNAVVTVTVFMGKCREGYRANNKPNTARAEEFRSAYESAKARYLAKWGDSSERGWLSYDRYQQKKEDRRNLGRAHDLQSHKARIRVLASVAA